MPITLEATYDAIDNVFVDRRQEAYELFHYAVKSLDEKNPEHLKALGRGQTFEIGYSPVLSRSYLKAAKALLKRIRDYEGVAIDLSLTFDFTDTSADISEYQKALSFTKKYGRHQDYLWMLHRYLLYRRNTGQFEDVVEEFKSSLKEIVSFDDALTRGSFLTVYGAYLVYNKHIEQGIAKLKESLSLHEALGYLSTIDLYCELGYAYFKLGAFDEAERYLRIGVKRYAELATFSFRAKFRSYLARIAIAKNDLVTARSYLLKALHLVSQGDEPGHICETLVGFADYLQATNSKVQAVEVWTFVQNSPLTELRDKNQAQERLEELKPGLTTEDYEHAFNKGKGLELEEIVKEALILLV